MPMLEKSKAQFKVTNKEVAAMIMYGIVVNIAHLFRQPLKLELGCFQIDVIVKVP